jgi:hypothetical protein
VKIVPAVHDLSCSDECDCAWLSNAANPVCLLEFQVARSDDLAPVAGFMSAGSWRSTLGRGRRIFCALLGASMTDQLLHSDKVRREDLVEQRQ